MNEAGNSAGPARGALHLELDRVLVVHDEIDLPFGEVRTRMGGGLAGHNGLKSLRRGLGSPDFVRVRVGVGRPGLDRPRDRLGVRPRALAPSPPTTCGRSSSAPPTPPSGSCSATPRRRQES